MLRMLAATLACLAGLAGGPVTAEEVDLELVLAADGSGSIDDDELRLQRQGYADAITDPAVLSAIASGLTGAIAVAYVEWGGPNSQHIIVDWQVIRDRSTAQAFAGRLRSEPRQAFGYNSISNALHYAAGMIRSNAHDGLRKIIDVSGDGPQMNGRPLPAVREAVLAEGIVINGLAIRRPGGSVGGPRGIDLVEHYNRHVIGGPGSFTMVADETVTFAEAVRQKLVQEIAGGPPALRAAAR